jgi:voltage-gated potassium channel
MNPPGAVGPRSERDARRLAEFERRMRLPIFLSAVLPIVFALAGRGSIVTNIVLVVAWVVFVADYVVHAALVRGYATSVQGVFDLLVAILTAPWFFIPGLGDARFVTVARLARLVRVLKVGRGLRRLAAQLGEVGLVVAALIFTCAYVAYSVERSVNPTFASFGDALWWATVTITTVGYGDIYPTTATGRFVAVVLMFSGIGVLGILAGALASFFGFGEQATTQAPPAASPAAVEPDPTGERDEVQAGLAELRARVAELDRAIAAVQRTFGASG